MDFGMALWHADEGRYFSPVVVSMPLQDRDEPRNFNQNAMVDDCNDKANDALDAHRTEQGPGFLCDHVGFDRANAGKVRCVLRSISLFQKAAA